MKKDNSDRVKWHRVGGLWIGVRGGGKFDAQEIIEALENADYSHLPSLNGLTK